MLFPKLPKRPKRKPDPPTLRGQPVKMRELRHYVIVDRDRVCVAYAAPRAVLDGHECRDAWGMPHAPHDLGKLELAHVPESTEANALGRKAPDDELHTVAECHGANVNVTRELRIWERHWLSTHEPPKG